ncbi:MAG TPA: DUF6538 domain-containing protein, partial [Luteolibacter sp.]|nr:DUF6538 domain-containing protein [Luteolibacter sp.]
MPRQQGLLQRGSRWFSNIKVPKDLVPAFGKQKICEALGTSDYREACRKIAFERARWAATFDTERKKAARHCPQQRAEKVILTTLSKAEAFELASRYLAAREGEMRGWMMSKGRFLPDHEKREVADSVEYDAAAYEEGFDDHQLPDGTDELKRFLEGQQINCPVTSPAFRALRPLIFEAHLEYLQRSGDIVSQNTVKERNPIFRGIHSHSPLAEEVKGYTVDDLIKGRDKAVSGGSLKSKIAAYPAARLLREVLGKNTLLSSISREDVERLFEVMENIPVNAAQRYRGMTYKQAIKAAAKCGDTRKPHTNTNWATYT